MSSRIKFLYSESVICSFLNFSAKYLEEKDLRKFIGEEYETYQKEVPMIIPFTKRKQ